VKYQLISYGRLVLSMSYQKLTSDSIQYLDLQMKLRFTNETKNHDFRIS